MPEGFFCGEAAIRILRMRVDAGKQYPERKTELRIQKHSDTSRREINVSGYFWIMLTAINIGLN